MFFYPAGCLASKHPAGSFILKLSAVYISSTRPGILRTPLKFGHEIIYVVSVGQGILYFYISGNARGF